MKASAQQVLFFSRRRCLHARCFAYTSRTTWIIAFTHTVTFFLGFMGKTITSCVKLFLTDRPLQILSCRYFLYSQSCLWHWKSLDVLLHVHVDYVMHFNSFLHAHSWSMFCDATLLNILLPRPWRQDQQLARKTSYKRMCSVMLRCTETVPDYEKFPSFWLCDFCFQEIVCQLHRHWLYWSSYESF